MDADLLWLVTWMMAAVPRPWTPVSAQGLTLDVWGRTCVLAQSGLPEQISSASVPLLAEPVSWELDGRTESAKSDCRIVKREPDRVCWQARGRLADSDYACDAAIEFDGMMRFDVSITPPTGKGLHQLSLRIAMTRPSTTLLHFYPLLRDYPQMTWFKPDEPNSIARPREWTSPFTPFVWLGNEERGLQWFCESDANWRIQQPEAAIKIREERDAVVLRVNLLDSRTALNEPFRITFGLMAGPVKPGPTHYVPPNLRYMHWATYSLIDPPMERLDRLQRMGARFLGMHEDWTDLQGMSVVTAPEKLRQLIDEVHRRKMGLVLYHSMAIPDIAPAYKDLGEECRCEPVSAFYVHAREPRQFAYPVCHRSRYSPVFTDGIASLFREYGIDGIYLDGAASPLHCANARHGCGYDAASGPRRPTFPIFAAREQMKRLRDLCDAQQKPTLIVAHMSALITLPTLSFADILLTGEQYWKAPVDFRPPLEFIRVECMGHPHGLPTHFIGYPPLGGPWATLVTGLHAAPSPWAPGGVDLWALFDRFGVATAQWHPYWSDRPPATADREEVRISGFCHPGRSALLAVGNVSAKSVEVLIRIHEQVVGFSPRSSQATDVTTSTDLAVEDGALRLDLAAESLHWLRINPAAK